MKGDGGDGCGGGRGEHNILMMMKKTIFNEIKIIIVMMMVMVVMMVMVMVMMMVMMKLTLDSVGIKVVTSSASNRLSWPKRLAAIWFTPL